MKGIILAGGSGARLYPMIIGHRCYKVDNYYSPECDRGLVFDDRTLNTVWQIPIDIKKTVE